MTRSVLWPKPPCPSLRYVSECYLDLGDVPHGLLAGLLDGGTTPDDISNAPTAISLRTITAVAAFEGFVEEARAHVNDEMEQMVITGLKNLV
jgi:hypothetical protein